MARYQDANGAKTAVDNPATQPDVLAQIARDHPEWRGSVAAHPNAYPELVQWINDQAATGTAGSAAARPGSTSAAPRARTGSRGGTRMLLGAALGFVAATLVGVLLIGTGVIGIGSNRETGEYGHEGPGFATPEDAAQAFLEGLRDGDFAAMASAYAIESFAENCDYAALLTRVRVHAPNFMLQSCPFPADDAVGARANLEARRAAVPVVVLNIWAAHVSPQMWNEGGYLTLDDDAQVREFLDQTAADFDDYLFAGIDNIQSATPQSVSDIYDESRSNIDAQATQYGLASEDYVDVALTFDIDGQSWLFAPTAGRYDDGRWYLVEPSGTLAALVGMESLAFGLSPRDDL